MRSHLAFIVTLPGLVAACRTQPVVDTTAARTSLRQADSAYTRTGVAKDRAAFLNLYAADAVMYPPAAATVSGIDAIGKFTDTFLNDPGFAGEFHPVAVDVSADGSMGYTLNNAALTVTGPDGKPVTERYRDFHVWRRSADGAWKLHIDIWNEEPPATPVQK